jgi:heme/copper-type cytochrome/quinol oxidase subunit 2
MIYVALFKITNFAAVISNCNPNKDNPNNPFFGFPHWWKYISTGQKEFGHCSPVIDFPNGLWSIALAVVDMLLYLAGVVAVISIIVAGIMYINTRGNVEKATSARTRLVNSLVGLVIVVMAIAIVSFLGSKIAG